jgi:hypothetical protein
MELPVPRSGPRYRLTAMAYNGAGGTAMTKVQLNEHLEPLATFTGKTWRGEFADSTPDKPKVDVARWESALKGNAVRVVHSVNDGEYGGETLIVWDEPQSTLKYFYFTTAGFHSIGTMTAEHGRYVATERVTGNASGVSEVKSTSHITPDGRLRVESQYFKHGTWVEGHDITYLRDENAQVVLP